MAALSNPTKTNFDSLALSWLAKGALEAYLLLFGRGPNWWDVITGLLIAQEAGAKITDRFGKPLNSLKDNP